MDKKERYYQLKAEGICTDCKKQPASKGKIRCASCIEKGKIRNRNKRIEYAKAGICPRCIKKKPEGWFFYHCPECKQNMKEYCDQYRENRRKQND